jgi:hypothetical protein
MINRKQNTDFGVILTLCLLISFWLCGTGVLLKLAVATLIITALSPVLFTPLSYLWYRLAYLGERFFSLILLAFIFYLLITPVGFFVRLFRRRPCFKQGAESVFVIKNKTYAAEDMEYQY